MSVQKVLIIEDERDLCELLRSAVPGIVSLAYNLEKARYLIGLNKYDCIITDVTLGDGQATSLEPLVEGIPIIYITGDENFTSENHIVLHKPFRMRDLRELLQGLGINVWSGGMP